MTLDGPNHSGAPYGSFGPSNPLSSMPAFHLHRQQQPLLPLQGDSAGMAVPTLGTANVRALEDNECFLTAEAAYQSVFGGEKVGPDTSHEGKWRDVRGRNRWQGTYVSDSAAQSPRHCLGRSGARSGPSFLVVQ